MTAAAAAFDIARFSRACPLDVLRLVRDFVGVHHVAAVSSLGCRDVQRDLARLSRADLERLYTAVFFAFHVCCTKAMDKFILNCNTTESDPLVHVDLLHTLMHATDYLNVARMRPFDRNLCVRDIRATTEILVQCAGSPCAPAEAATHARALAIALETLVRRNRRWWWW
jgi:hypothetical protein